MNTVLPLPIFRRPWETSVRVFPLDEVTTVNDAAEQDARASGLSREAIDAIWTSVTDLYRTGLHPAISVCVRHRGHVILDRAIGHARGNAPGDPASTPKVQATPDTLFNLFSASKAISAMVLHLLDERRLVHLDDAVAEYIPEFGQHGKEWVTLRHVLTHRAGIPQIPAEYLNLELLADPAKIVRVLCEAKPTFPAGRRLAYHALTGGFVIGEIVKRVTGKSIHTFLKKEILQPLGFRHHNYGLPAREFSKLALGAFTGPATIPPYSWLLKRALGVSMQDAVDLSNDPRFYAAPIPSGNIVSNANEACRFYEMLRNEGELDGLRIFDPRTVRRATSEQSYLEPDLTLIFPVRYGLGFMLGAKYASPYGHDTRHAYGHLGFTNVLSWADPERELSAAVLTSGKPLVSPWVLYWLQIMRTMARVIPRTGNVRSGKQRMERLGR